MAAVIGSSGVWTAIVLGHCTRGVLSVARFRQGKWRHIVVEWPRARLYFTQAAWLASSLHFMLNRAEHAVDAQ
jgi:hypothetical protein